MARRVGIPEREYTRGWQAYQRGMYTRQEQIYQTAGVGPSDLGPGYPPVLTLSEWQLPQHIRLASRQYVFYCNVFLFDNFFQVSDL